MQPHMPVTLKKRHPTFVAEAIVPALLCEIDDQQTLADIRNALDEYAVLVFPAQPMTDEQQLAFAERLDGELHSKTGSSALGNNRFGNEALADISNVDEHDDLLSTNDRRRDYGLANRLWHTDASFQDPPGRYSMLSAKVIPAHGGDTYFADTRAAYDQLDSSLKAQLDGLHAHHSIAYSREVLGFEFSDAEKEQLKGAVHPLVYTFADRGRKALYVASHATRIVELPLAEGRLLLRDLIEHATRPEFVYEHRWQVDDFVIWDNRATMHRGSRFDDSTERRELRRVTTLDIEA